MINSFNVFCVIETCFIVIHDCIGFYIINPFEKKKHKPTTFSHTTVINYLYYQLMFQTIKKNNFSNKYLCEHISYAGRVFEQILNRLKFCAILIHYSSSSIKLFYKDNPINSFFTQTQYYIIIRLSFQPSLVEKFRFLCCALNFFLFLCVIHFPSRAEKEVHFRAHSTEQKEERIKSETLTYICHCFSKLMVKTVGPC